MKLTKIITSSALLACLSMAVISNASAGGITVSGVVNHHWASLA